MEKITIRYYESRRDVNGDRLGFASFEVRGETYVSHLSNYGGRDIAMLHLAHDLCKELGIKEIEVTSDIAVCEMPISSHRNFFRSSLALATRYLHYTGRQANRQGNVYHV